MKKARLSEKRSSQVWKIDDLRLTIDNSGVLPVKPMVNGQWSVVHGYSGGELTENTPASTLCSERPAVSPSHLIVGLGNPGPEYAKTRHNVGFMVVDALGAQGGSGDWFLRCSSMVCWAEVGGTRALLAKPLTFMNLSGHAVKLLLAESRMSASSLLLVYDDVNLPLSKIRIRERGSSGGHLGVESVVRALDSEEIARVRLGIGEEIALADKREFVLSEFPTGREKEVDDMILRAADAVKMILRDGIQKAMSVYNLKKHKEKGICAYL